MGVLVACNNEEDPIKNEGARVVTTLFLKLFEAAKSMFESWDSCAVWTWLQLKKYLNWALICIHDVTRESVAAVTDHFANVFFRENVVPVFMTLWRRNDVWKLDADAILFWEIKGKKRDI